jgi:diguanylate cyclase (GGDEF)-like protein/PAS domain S-box-containing protein
MAIKNILLDNFNSLIENNPDGIAIHTCGVVKYVNAKVLTLLGASTKDELLGKNIFEILHPSYHASAKKRIQKALNNMESTPMAEYEIYKMDGSLIDVELVSLPFMYESELAIQVIIKDISERKRSYKAIKVSEQKFRALFDTAPDAIILSNLDGIIISWNKTAEQLLGYSYEEVIGKSWLSLIPKRFRNEHVENFAEIKKDTSKPIYIADDLWVLTKSGEEIPVDATVGYWRTNGDVFFTTILRDISERKKFEDQLKFLATTDHLTGVLNRRTGLMLIEQAMKTAKRDKSKFTLCYLDLDNFKAINDACGHVEGDVVLRKVAKLIKDNLREADIFCRLGGDEFIIAWHDVDHTRAQILWKRIVQKFDERKDTRIGISVGFVSPDLTEKIDLDKIIDAADKKMYEEKNKK